MKGLVHVLKLGEGPLRANVTVRDGEFDPREVTVGAWAIVTWTNAGSMVHTVYEDAAPASKSPGWGALASFSALGVAAALATRFRSG
jgi:plastocyanin